MTGESAKSKRLLCQLHGSTWLVLALVAGVLILMIVPGERIGRRIGQSELAIYEHGWPTAYCRREFKEGQKTSADEDFATWRRPAAWSWRATEGAFQLSWTAVAVDTAAAGILVFTAALAEVWRRRRRKVYHIHVLDLALATACVALYFGWWTAHQRRHEQEQQVVDALSQRAQFRWHYAGPIWFSKLLGRRALARDLESVQRVTIDDAKDSEVAALIGLRKLEHLSLGSSAASPLTDAALFSIAQLTNLRTLGIYNPRITDQGLVLRSLSHLEELYLGGTPRVSQSGVQALQQALPNCKIDAQVWSETQTALP